MMGGHARGGIEAAPGGEVLVVRSSPLRREGSVPDRAGRAGRQDGRPGLSPAQPATVCVLQFLLDLLDLPDRQVAEAVRCRIDFDPSVPADFRDRLVQGRTDRSGTRQNRRRPVPVLTAVPNANATTSPQCCSAECNPSSRQERSVPVTPSGRSSRPSIAPWQSSSSTANAVSLWVTLHGLVTLELAGALNASGAAFRSTILSVTPAPRCQERKRTLPGAKHRGLLSDGLPPPLPHTRVTSELIDK